MNTVIPFDDTHWTPKTGTHGTELQRYTVFGNLSVDNWGTLIITARQQPDGGWTSGWVDTKGKLDIVPGSYVEASVVIPTGRGVWPAMWLVGANEATVGWPQCGEIDVFEVIGGGSPTTVRHTLHQDNAAGQDVQVGWSTGSSPMLPGPHAYGVHFDANGVRWYIDRKVVYTVTRAQVEARGGIWRFGAPMNLIFNVAVGSIGGVPDPTVYPQSMFVVGSVLVVPPPGVVPGGRTPLW